MIETATIGREAPRPAGPSVVVRPRHPEFDAIRATSTLLVVTVHAALAYTQIPIPGLLWGVRDPSPHRAFDLFCWWSMGVSVSLFFAMSGFFAAEVYEAKGPAGFLRGRARRIVVPFLLASATVLPACFLAIAFGWIVTGRAEPGELRWIRFKDPAIRSDLYGPAYLWFLEYLILMLGGFWAVRTWIVPPRPPRPDAGRLLLGPWAPLALAVPTAILLKLSRDRAGIDVTLDRHNSFVPDALRLAHYAILFAFGVGLQRAPRRLDDLARRAPWYLLAAVPAYLVRARLLPLDWSSPLPTGGSLALAASGGLFAWLSVFGFLGLYRRLFARPSAATRYLADASFWIYLTHMPVVAMAQADLYPTRLPTALKFAIVWAVTMGLGLGSYHVLHRRPAPKPAPDPNAPLAGPHRARRGEGVRSGRA